MNGIPTVANDSQHTVTPSAKLSFRGRSMVLAYRHSIASPPHYRRTIGRCGQAQYGNTIDRPRDPEAQYGNTIDRPRDRDPDMSLIFVVCYRVSPLPLSLGLICQESLYLGKADNGRAPRTAVDGEHHRWPPPL